MEAPNKKPLGVEDAARFLKVSKSFLYKLTAEGRIPHYKPGKRIVFLESELLEFIKDNKVSVSASERKYRAAKHTVEGIK